MLAPRVARGRPVSLSAANEGRCRQSLGSRPGTAPGCARRASRSGTVRVARVLLVIVALAATSLGADLAVASPAAADGGISDTISDGAYTFQYTMTGVTAGPGDAAKSRVGTVTGTTVTLSGTVTFTGDVFTFGATVMLMGGSTPVTAGPPHNDSHDTKTISWPFSLNVVIPPEGNRDVTFQFRSSICETGASQCDHVVAEGLFTVEATPTPTPTLRPTPTPGPTEKPCADAGTRFSSLSGQVEVAHEGPDKLVWDVAKMNTVLCVDDHVKTAEDSTAIIGWADLSTFLLKPESEIVCSSPPSHDSKIGLVLGNIWVNVKKMANNGTMEVDMSQAVAGIKGTTFVLGETGSASTLKVIEGTVAFTSKATGKTVAVSAGQTVQADRTGLSAVTSFDATAESADWAKLGAGTTAIAPGAGAAPDSGGLPLVLFAALAALLLACILLVARRRRHI